MLAAVVEALLSARAALAALAAAALAAAIQEVRPGKPELPTLVVAVEALAHGQVMPELNTAAQAVPASSSFVMRGE